MPIIWSADAERCLIGIHSHQIEAFWGTLDRLMQDHDKRKGWLRQHGVGMGCLLMLARPRHSPKDSQIVTKTTSKRMTWIEVASDAVKIGLGAFVAGLFAVLLAFFNHRFKTREKTGDRLRDALDKIIDDFEEVALSTLNEARAMRSYYEKEDLNENLFTPAKAGDAKGLFRALEKMEYRLAILGFDKAVAEVASYRELFLKMEYLEEGGENDRFSKFEFQLEDQQAVVLKRLSAAYKSI